MPLRYPSAWRFSRLQEEAISDSAIADFHNLIGLIGAQGNTQLVLSCFKGFLANATGSTKHLKSSRDWIETEVLEEEVLSYMRKLALHPPLFLEAFHDACQSFYNTQYDVPDVELINNICCEHGINYQIVPPELKRLDKRQEVISVIDASQKFAESSVQLLEKSLERAEQLLEEKRPREAVQETLWLLESIATAFKGTSLVSGTIKTNYFNKIAKELQTAYPGTTLKFVLDGACQLHGYLSSPTGGGVRHGIDLTDGKPLTLAEGYLFCNLIRSYMKFLLSEHERLVDVSTSDERNI
ncbi:hypothetical protein [Geitlerinema sp. PCC 7407]|uniref:hypothetical protein n=1 Tax=Geitlerinema sp. PCC 7407 TaxID=1173025 RepID=UPI00029FB1AB|nr:hypothetical protein [Geitlerinema sp. PCC 7407]AFY66645.1 hypothetical protein GEI7407_2165 [Geitlerinema sp. PCC 7407]